MRVSMLTRERCTKKLRRSCCSTHLYTYTFIFSSSVMLPCTPLVPQSYSFPRPFISNTTISVFDFIQDPSFPVVLNCSIVPARLLIIIIIIIIINEKINVAFSRRTARTRNSHKKHKPRKRRVSTEEEKIVMKMTARKAVSSAAA